MPQRTMTAAACRSCTNLHGKAKSPCFTAHVAMQQAGCTTFQLASADKIPAPCLFAAEWWEISPLVKAAGGKGLSHDATNAVKTMAHRHKKYNIASPLESPDTAKLLGFVERSGRQVYESGDSGVWLPVAGGAPYYGPDYLFIAGYHDPAVWHAFITFYRHEVSDDLEGWDTADKIAYTLKKAASETPGELGTMLSDMTKPENIAKAVVIFGAMAILGSLKIALYLKWLFALGAAADSLMSYANLLYEAANGIGQAKMPGDLDRAASKLAKFFAELSKDAIIAAAGYTVGKLAVKFRQWFLGHDPHAWEHQAEIEAKEYREHYRAEKHDVHKEIEHLETHSAHNPTIDHFAQGKRYQQAMQFLTGMQRRHLNGWAVWCKRNKKILIMRTANEESLWRREMSGVLGKPVSVKWKTFKTRGHKWEGLVVRPSKASCSAKEWADEMQTQKKLEKAGFRFVEDPDTGVALVMKGRPAKAYTSDYDKMGIYQRNAGGHGYRHDPRYDGEGDANKAWQDDINKNVSPEKAMDMHGCNDKFKKKITVNGEEVEVMGREPGEDEKFLVVDENGTGWIVPSVEALKRFYIDYLKAPWPYKV